MNIADLFPATNTLLLQLLVFLIIPVTWRYFRAPTCKFTAEEVWAAGLLSVCMQVISGTLWSAVLANRLPPPGELILFISGGIFVGELLVRKPIPTKALQSKLWLLILILITLIVRILPSMAHSSLGQSDAYSHFQFGLSILENGKLHNPFYPVGHAWLQVLPSMVFRTDPYPLYQFGGAVYGLALILGIFFCTRRACSEPAATCAALLAATSPLMLPLIKTGVGVYANQLGLLLVIFILWTFPGRFPLALPALAALVFSVPMMMLDLIPVLSIFLLFKGSKKQLVLLFIIGGGGVSLILLKLISYPPEHLEATCYMLSGQHEIRSFPQLFLHYLSWKPVALPLAVQIGVALCSLLSFSLLWFPQWRKPTHFLLPLLTGISAFQSFSGCLQFANYQRAGWLFLIGLSMIAGPLAWALAKKLHLHVLARPALAFSGLVLFWFPPIHHPHLSASEDALVNYLREIPQDAKGIVWTRTFNNFSGGQGDPVYALLQNHPHIKVKQVDIKNTPNFTPHEKTWVIIDTSPPPKTGHAVHDKSVLDLWKLNDRLREQLETIPLESRTKIVKPGLEIWVWSMSELEP